METVAQRRSGGYWPTGPFKSHDLDHGTCVECGSYRWRITGEVIRPADCVNKDRDDHKLERGHHKLQDGRIVHVGEFIDPLVAGMF